MNKISQRTCITTLNKWGKESAHKEALEEKTNAYIIYFSSRNHKLKEGAVILHSSFPPSSCCYHPIHSFSFAFSRLLYLLVIQKKAQYYFHLYEFKYLQLFSFTTSDLSSITLWWRLGELQGLNKQYKQRGAKNYWTFLI